MAGDPEGRRADGAGGHRDRHHARGRTGHRRDRPLAGHRRSDRLDQHERLRGAHDDAPGVRVPAVLPGPRLVPRGCDGLHPHHQHRPGLGGRPDTDPHRDGAQPHRPADHPLLRPPRSALRGRHPVAQRIDITDLNVYYGAFRAVADVTMVIEPRSVTAIIGPSDLEMRRLFSRIPASTFSATDIVGNGLGRWKTIPTCRRTATGSTSEPYRSTPSIATFPSTRAPGMTSCMRLSVRMKVDFPQPDGPMIAVTERGSITIVTSATARNAP